MSQNIPNTSFTLPQGAPGDLGVHARRTTVNCRYSLLDPQNDKLCDQPLLCYFVKQEGREALDVTGAPPAGVKEAPPSLCFPDTSLRLCAAAWQKGSRRQGWTPSQACPAILYSSTQQLPGRCWPDILQLPNQHLHFPQAQPRWCMEPARRWGGGGGPAEPKAGGEAAAPAATSGCVLLLLSLPVTWRGRSSFRSRPSCHLSQQHPALPARISLLGGLQRLVRPDQNSLAAPSPL